MARQVKQNTKMVYYSTTPAFSRYQKKSVILSFDWISGIRINTVTVCKTVLNIFILQR
jgi:hypothetical protein